MIGLHVDRIMLLQIRVGALLRKVLVLTQQVVRGQLPDHHIVETVDTDGAIVHSSGQITCPETAIRHDDIQTGQSARYSRVLTLPVARSVSASRRITGRPLLMRATTYLTTKPSKPSSVLRIPFKSLEFWQEYELFAR